MIKLREFLGLSYYTSQLDKFLRNFRKSDRQLSKAQRAEIEKYQSVHQQRDGVSKNNASAPNHQKLWEQF
jgi:hypothetical protein